jgi:hypothetical protein
MFEMILDNIRAAPASATLAMSLKHGAKRPFYPKDPQTFGLFAAAVISAIVPLEISHLVCMLVGAAGYFLLQILQPTLEEPLQKVAEATPTSCATPPRLRPRERNLAAHQNRTGMAAPRMCIAPKPEVRTPSAVPVTPPVFQSAGWPAEVNELLEQITPTPKCNTVVTQIARVVKQAIQHMLPEAEVVGFANGNLMSGKAFGVAVPEVDIVVNVSPTILQRRLPRNSFKPQADSHKLLKSAIRACTDRLVSSGGFKFRRSAFRGEEPKVILVVPTSLGIFSESVAVNFTINSVTPFYNAALITECGQMEANAQGLIMLVKRWAKDRGVCHAAKGHLPPYLWTLLSVYFLQVDESDKGPLLPPLEAFAISSSLVSKVVTPPGKPKRTSLSGGPKKSISELFKAFMQFYNKQFDWRNEAVSVRHGCRGPPDVSLPLHIILHCDGRTSEVGPSIEDPFEAAKNLGNCMTASSFAHLRAEFARADELCSSGESLAKLLEPWVPSETESMGRSGKDEQDDGEDE